MTEPKHCVTVAVINRKGGTGKTTVTANLAGELASRGLNVGAVDTDAQGGSHLALCLGVEAGDGLYRALVENAALEQVASEVEVSRYGVPGDFSPPGALWVLPAAGKTYRIPDECDDVDAFGRLLDEFAAVCLLDVILIDTGPSKSKFDAAIYAATDLFLYVTQAETLALVGIAESFEEIRNFNRARLRRGERPNQILGIVPNLVGRLREHSLNLNALGDAFGAGMIWPPLRRLNVFSQMAARGQIVRAYAPHGDEARQIVALVERFEREVATWLQTTN